MKQKTYLLIVLVFAILGLFITVKQRSGSELSNPDAQILSLNLVIKEAITQLSPEHPFVHFNLNLAEKDQAILQKIDIQRRETYENFGKLDVSEKGIADFLKKVGKNDQQVAAKAAGVITRLVHTILAGCQKESAWVALRAFVATDEYDQSRWHRDGYYFSPFSGAPFKFVVALKGASTQFYRLPAEIRERFAEFEKKQERAKLAKLLDPSRVDTAMPGQGTAFVVGAEFAAVHSEPKIVGQRLFLSIVPGSWAEIEELNERWHPPRRYKTS